LFVADSIPLEVRRIVEFLNNQMPKTEVLAIELRQFVTDRLRTIVPTVYGQSPLTYGKRTTVGRRWNEVSLFEKLAQNASDTELDLARRIFSWMNEGGKRPVVFGTGKDNGSVYPLLKPEGVAINPFYLSSDGKVYVQFGSLANKPVFGDLAKRRELMQHFNSIRGVHFGDTDLTRYPSITLRQIVQDPNGVDHLFTALEWMDRQIQSAGQTGR
jgi:hypothetical protein